MELDPITAAFILALTNGAATVGKRVIPDAYDACKNLIKKGFGEKSYLAKALNDLEVNPNDQTKHRLLHEQVIESGANKDAEILQQVAELLKEINEIADKEPKRKIIGISLKDVKARTEIMIAHIKVKSLVGQDTTGFKAERVEAEKIHISSIEIDATSSEKK